MTDNSSAENPLATVSFLTEKSMLLLIDEGIRKAEQKMDMADAPDDDESFEEAEALYEARYHCGVCVVREVMETVWPPVEAYIEFLQDRIAELQQDVTP